MPSAAAMYGGVSNQTIPESVSESPLESYISNRSVLSDIEIFSYRLYMILQTLTTTFRAVPIDHLNRSL